MASKKLENQETVQLILPKYDENSTAKGWDDAWDKFPASIEKITGWFNQYQVDNIELWISGVMETSGITKLVVSAKGEGGLKVVLKPKRTG